MGKLTFYAFHLSNDDALHTYTIILADKTGFTLLKARARVPWPMDAPN